MDTGLVAQMLIQQTLLRFSFLQPVILIVLMVLDYAEAG